MNEQNSFEGAPGSVADLLEKLDASIDGFPKRLKQCADFTRRHLHLIAVSTVSEMAHACEVAPSVYMRFCQVLGFSGYSEMQALFRAQYTELRPNYEMRLASLREEGALGTSRLLADFTEAGHKSLLSLGNTVTHDAIDRVARGMAEARVVHLVGLRRAFSVVSNMAYILDQLGVPAALHFGAGMLNSDKSILEGDVLFAVTYAPFSEETVRLAGRVAERGITVFGLTDSEQCPLAESASDLLMAREAEVGGFRAPNASMALTTALAVAIKALRQPG
ncbi:MurR/RpiR family transcriptional regulator [Algicella marina]|uniref:SIS domain-containing protein n=1 Tax=Algicella marina TaxID=2683284 RepID=A0A6P1T044_9RHOB|nr:MurR/RpiR family transcriptional regulator [Algicella marina]QHQ35377.1 SIS domain-containing protein [Algicella marina]